MSVSKFNGVFTPPDSDSDSYVDSYSHSYEIGFNNNVQNCFLLWFLDGSCAQFDTDIGTDNVFF